jgi:1-deoxy-D-xylulose-5-phosphate reductoisomerase
MKSTTKRLVESKRPVSVCLLGATGSIGQSSLDVIRRNPERYHLVSASGYSNMELLADICREFKPETVVVGTQAHQRHLAALLNGNPQPHIGVGVSALEEIAKATDTSLVIAAIVGAAGLASTLAAVNAGKRVLLANKEALVMSGSLLMASAQRSGAELLPIDSEHNAIFQCLSDRLQQACSLGHAREIRKLLLTASGGPFLGLKKHELANITPAQAIDHPNWSMGPKISVDSATLMNKGLELIEACWLFAVEPTQIEVVIHPQSFIHSMVEYIDGSVIAQMGLPDMRTPIAHAMAWPERIESGVGSPVWTELSNLTFDTPDLEAFPCLALAMNAQQTGGTAPAILNAANEVAVNAFLSEQIPFIGIPALVSDALAAASIASVDTIEAVLEADAWARRWINHRLEKM